MLFGIKKIVTPFLLPPGLFIVLLAGMAVKGFFQRQNRAHRSFWAMAILLWLFSTGPFADMLAAPLERAYPVPADPGGDVIILLTGGAYDDVPDMSGIGAPAPNTIERLVTAARLHRKLQIPILISGGRVDSQRIPLSHVTRRFLLDLGIASQDILVEDRSRDTYENGLYSKQVCVQHGFTRPLLVTSAIHMQRAMFVSEAIGLHAIPFPCGLTTWQNKKYTWLAFLPSAASFKKTAAAMHEWMGLLYYQIVNP
ncbi:YdcF family protein [Desulfogranum japonicum]|uniref:YdcF family protein n=1 Tax=Desulfogranum japonicum TaxID=231447 RepID=UPI0004045E33|nr:YdcF family protein [Desulfogranum japonicum]